MDSLLTVIDPAVSTLLEKALNGGELNFNEGVTLARTRDTSSKRWFLRPIC
jgi:hypothetical protein